MEIREQIAHLAATREEEVLLVRVCERIRTAAQREVPAATCFLSRREQMLVSELLRGETFRFIGGLASAEREVCCYLPDYLDEDWLTGGDGPIAAVRAAFHARDTLTHRDFLGALMGCGIKRETVGDIYVAEGRCDFLVTRDILPYVLQNLTDAGRTRLHLEELPLSALEARFWQWPFKSPFWKKIHIWHKISSYSFTQDNSRAWSFSFAVNSSFWKMEMRTSQ